MRPDLTGYTYTATSWPNQSNAYDGPKGTAPAESENFVAKRASASACAAAGTVTACESLNNIRLNSFRFLAASGTGPGSHGAWGTNRRIVTVAVTDSSMRVIDFVCMLMLQPLSVPMTDVQLEFIGNASLASSPCSFSGMPGGAAGPLVPALVR
jgi:hypothetical protein